MSDTLTKLELRYVKLHANLQTLLDELSTKMKNFDQLVDEQGPGVYGPNEWVRYQEWSSMIRKIILAMSGVI